MMMVRSGKATVEVNLVCVVCVVLWVFALGILASAVIWDGKNFDETFGFMGLFVAGVVTICRSTAKTREMLQHAYELGRDTEDRERIRSVR